MSGGPNMGQVVYLPFQYPSTELLAGTVLDMVAPPGWYIHELRCIVDTAVTTGGAVTMKAGSDGNTAVAGLSVTIADAATKGTVVADSPTPKDDSTLIPTNGRMQVIAAAAFATAGSLRGFVKVGSSPLQQ